MDFFSKKLNIIYKIKKILVFSQLSKYIPHGLGRMVYSYINGTFLYDGYFQMPNYDEYFLYEYDTISNVSIEEFFNTDVDFFGNGVRSPADEKWWWPELYRKLNPYNVEFTNVHSYGQSTCIYFKNHILKHCAEEVVKNKHLYCEMLSEIRGGTLVSQITTLKSGREDIEKYISWTSDDIKIDLNKPHFYHPVK